MKTARRWAASLGCVLFLAGCLPAGTGQAPPRLVMFVGVDISGSFLRGDHFDDSLDFLARYLHGHLRGEGGLEVPQSLFVGSIGGAKANEPKTFFPIEAFQGKTVEEIRARLDELFPKKVENPYTDYNAFFTQVADTVRNRNLALKPLSIVLISDGKVDAARGKGKRDIRSVSLTDLEKLTRNVTIRLLYTDAVTGSDWQNRLRRRRVKVWTQDAAVMGMWKDPAVWLTDRSEDSQPAFEEWVKKNVDFNVRARRVD